MQSRGEKGNWIKKAFQATVSALKRAFLWIKRMIFGEKSADLQGAEIEKPSQLLKEAFFRRKTAVAALILLFSLFLFVFIAPPVQVRAMRHGWASRSLRTFLYPSCPCSTHCKRRASERAGIR